MRASVRVEGVGVHARTCMCVHACLRVCVSKCVLLQPCLVECSAHGSNMQPLAASLHAPLTQVLRVLCAGRGPQAHLLCSSLPFGTIRAGLLGARAAAACVTSL